MERLEQRIERFLRTGEGDFDSLALELFAYQFERNQPYQAFCQAQGRTPANVRLWSEIPAVPIRAFKSSGLATFPITQAAAVFHSSATTTGQPSHHYLRTLTYYETALKNSFGQWVMNAPHPCLPAGRPSPLSHGERVAEGRVRQDRPFLILTPSPGEAPHSSLVWMMDVVKRTWGAPGSLYLVKRGRLDELWMATLLSKAQAADLPVLFLGTTIAYLSFFDYAQKAGKSYRLPAGSQLLDTGGMKTEKRQITRRQFVETATSLFGLAEEACINEYGMCELGSQFYGRGASSYLEGPAWVRTRTINPGTGEPCASGQPGLLCHFDLANVDSVLAVQTEDMGTLEGNGFHFHGRAPEAELKGCSLDADALLR